MSPWLKLRGRVLLVLAALVALAAALRALAWPVAPDSWDGVGFVEAVTDLDLAAFRPHPPGYPLFVAASRLFHRLGLPPLAAVVATSFVAGTALPVAGYALARRAFGGVVAPLFAAAALACAPGFVVAGATTWSDGCALTLTLLAYCFALPPRSWADDRVGYGPPTGSSARRREASAATAPIGVGLLAAAAIGVRPSSLLLVLPAIVVVETRRRGGALKAGIACLLGVATWSIPTAMVVGATAWWRLSTGQLAGHLARWGESSATWEGSGSTRAIANAVALQTISLESAAAGDAVVLALVALLALAVTTVRGTRPLVPLLVVAPYAVAIALLQPVAAAPRHALPITAAVVVALAGAVAVLVRRGTAVRVMMLALLAGAAVRGAGAAREHATPPAAVAMLRSITADPALARAAVVGGRSSRFGAWAPGVRVAPGVSAGDAVVFATRADPLPRPLLVTSELDLAPVPHQRLTAMGRFYRASPLDRRERGLELFALDLGLPH